MDLNMTYLHKGENNVPISLTCSWGGGHLNDLLIPPADSHETAPVIFMGIYFHLF